MATRPGDSGVDADAAELFVRAVGEVKAVAGRPSPRPPAGVRPPPSGAPAGPAPPAALPGAAAPLPDLVVGDFAGVDRRTAERLRRGRLPIDDCLDLHGCDRAGAAAAVARFVAAASARGARCVVIVTGKGAVSTGGGVLRRDLPRWLNRPSCRRGVLAVARAQPRHGGAGAFYVLLRRRR